MNTILALLGGGLLGCLIFVAGYIIGARHGAQAMMRELRERMAAEAKPSVILRRSNKYEN